MLDGGRLALDRDQVDAWLGTLNDLRLVLGTRLEVTEDTPLELPDDDPRAQALLVYGWLGWLQESLLSCISPPADPLSSLASCSSCRRPWSTRCWRTPAVTTPTSAAASSPARDGVATRLFEMTNAERSPTGFTFDSAEWLRVYREIDDADEDLLVVYHSHTMTEAYPSRTDVTWSVNTPGTSWLLVSTRSDEDEVRSYRIDDGVVAEEELRLV